MRWIDIKNLDELKSLGKFIDLKRDKGWCRRKYKNYRYNLEIPFQYLKSKWIYISSHKFSLHFIMINNYIIKIWQISF